MWAADLVVGAGGTMTREGALLGIPTFSVFAGRTPAVDDWLCGEGMLRRLRDAAELFPLACRSSEPQPLEQLRARSDFLAGVFVDALEATVAAAGGRRALRVGGRPAEPAGGEQSAAGPG